MKSFMIKEDRIRTVEYTEIGKVSFIKKAKVKNLRITIRSNKDIQVVVPCYVSFETACRFVENKKPWIRRSIAKLENCKKEHLLFNESTAFQTFEHILKLERHEKATIKTIIGNRHILLLFPVFANVEDTRIQKSIRNAIQKAWRIEAARHLPVMTKFLASKWHFTYQKLYFRNNKTRWGSCSRNNNLSLNIHLMRIPEHLREYVILHELCHTIHKHHQKSFWLQLDHVTEGKARNLDKELNQYHPQIW